MTNKDYELLIRKTQEISELIPINNSEFPSNAFKYQGELYGQYIQNIERFTSEQQSTINKTLEILDQQFNVQRNYLKLQALKENRENPEAVKKTLNALEKIFKR
ncbi:MAG: hypothetical protein PF542_04100 [Nanoarchaeota archaeon]|jgi:hypothetical protein|nr:hypothetical protein [Nanoarchaeota archaeon]